MKKKSPLALAKKLFPICRSITGDGVRRSLAMIRDLIPELEIVEVPSGTKCFDWIVPEEWNIIDAYIEDSKGKKIVSFHECNLHVVSYSIPVDKFLSLKELQKNLYSLPDKPDAIPYVMSYYKKHWGFCIQENLRKTLVDDTYHVVINSSLKNGSLTYGEVFLPATTRETSQEVFLSTYICHPSLANNEISGPVVTTFLIDKLKKMKRNYSYRIIFIPETIGSIVYLSKHYLELKKNVVAGYNITCVGDDRTYSYLPSRNGDSLSDRIAKHVLNNVVRDYKQYSYLDRGSDERQYCWPGIDLPIATIMRTKYGEYDEYHTSLDNLSLLTETSLKDSISILYRCLVCIEENKKINVNTLCEPHLSKYNLYDSLNINRRSNNESRIMLNILTYADDRYLLDIADIIGVPMWDLYKIKNTLLKNKLVTENF